MVPVFRPRTSRLLCRTLAVLHDQGVRASGWTPQPLGTTSTCLPQQPRQHHASALRHMGGGPLHFHPPIDWLALQLPLGARALASAAAEGEGTVVSFPLAQTGEGISECELMQWFIKEGDVVEAFQPLCEVQSDKASIEITSKYSGVVVKVHHGIGGIVKVGAPLVDIRVTDGSASAGSSTSTDSSSSMEVVAEAAEQVSAAGVPDPPAAVSRAMEEAAAASSSSDVQQSLAARAAAAAKDSTKGMSAASSMECGAAGQVFASPAVRRLARELGVVLEDMKGSGAGGRILREDVERMAHKATQPTPSGRAAAEPAPVRSSLAHAGDARQQYQPTRIPIRGYRRAMVKSSTEAGNVPMFYYFDDVAMDALMATRVALKGDPAMGPNKLTYLPFIIKAMSIAMAKYPAVNACLSSGGDELLLHGSHAIGVAMATSGGLVVPNIKQVESKGLVEIAAELAELQQLAAAGKLSVKDVTGGGITISNIGTLGGTNATPLVNPPEAAIVALGRVRPMPRYHPVTGELVKQHVMAISWGADHRVVDGATIAEFSNCWKALLEEPQRLMLHMR